MDGVIDDSVLCLLWGVPVEHRHHIRTTRPWMHWAFVHLARV